MVNNFTKPQNQPLAELGNGDHVLAMFWLRAQVLSKFFIVIVWTKSLIPVKIFSNSLIYFFTQQLFFITYKQVLVNRFNYS